MNFRTCDEPEIKHVLDDVYSKVKACEYNSLAIQDEDTRDVIRNLIFAVEEIIECVKKGSKV